MRRSLLTALLAAVALAGCGGSSSSENEIPVERSGEAITSPDTGSPYETGGADGSGADGNPGDQDPEARGGIAAGPDASDERK